MSSSATSPRKLLVAEAAAAEAEELSRDEEEDLYRDEVEQELRRCHDRLHRIETVLLYFTGFIVGNAVIQLVCASGAALWR